MADPTDRLAAALSGQYTIERVLGRGGMATVYLAEDVRHRRKVAVKVLQPELAASIGPDRFLREIEIAARLSHPHILPLHDSGEREGLLYYVMPYVEGESLRDRIHREKQLPVEDAMRVLREVANALAYAHSVGVVHRDIKPENILLQEGHAVVSDFGIARALNPDTHPGITETGMAVGTPAYMSPEQASGEGMIDARSDVYALATVFYEMLAGETPYQGATPQAIFARQLSGEFRPLTPLRSVTPALDAVLRKALAPTPADRHAGTMQFSDAVRHAIEHPGGVRRALPRFPKLGSRWLGWAAVAVIVVGVGLGGWRLIGAVHSPRAATIVVLPFANVGGDRANQVFADGIVEVLTSKLTQLEPFFDRPLWVIPASEVRSRDVQSADAARRDFGATLAVSGSVQRHGDAIGVTLNLVDASTLKQLRSDVVDGSVHDVSLWQDGIITRVANMLDFEMRPTAQHVLEAGGTSEAGAYDLYVQGNGYLQGTGGVDNLDSAVASFRRATDRDPRFTLAYTGLAEAYWQLYRETRDTAWVGRAIGASRQALSLDDSLPAVWVTLGLIHNGTGQSADAVTELQRALALEPSNSEALSRLADAYARLGRVGAAESTYARAIALKPYDWRAYNALGVFYYRQGRYDDAAQELEHVTELNPLNAHGFTNAGGIYFALGRWEDARRMFERAIEIEPTADAYSNVGTVDYFEGRYRDAVEQFRHGVQLREDDYLMWGNLASALYRVPDGRRESLDTYRRAIRLAEGVRRVNPNDPSVLSTLANYHAMVGDTAVAEQLLRQVVPLAGDDPQLMFDVAVAYEELGERDQALDWLGRALGAGYSRKVVDATPELADLRADPRYRGLAVK